MMLKKKNYKGALTSELRKEKVSKMKGGQRKLDMDKDGKITGKDFKMLKKIKKK